MRRRLVFVFVALTVLVVALYGVPRAFIRVGQIEEREQEQVDQSALLLAALVGAQEGSGRAVTEDVLLTGLRPGERVEYVAPDGTSVAAGDPAGREVGVAATAAVPRGGSLTLDYSRDAIGERVRAALLPLLLIGLLLVVLAWLAALVLARHLARPFRELAGHARSLGSGRFELDVPRYDVPEAEAVGQALVFSARNLALLVRRERDFAVNASHELRTPLTAARLRLEDLSLWPATPPEVAAELEETLVELNRLDAAVAALLEHARDDRHAAAVDVDLETLVIAAADRWRPRLVAQGRGVTLDVGRDLHARLVPDSADEVLDALLDHVLEHGVGEVTLATDRTPAYLEVRVGDESTRTQGTELLYASGAHPTSALSRAAELAASQGGHLTVGTGPTTSFVLRLPSPDHAGNDSRDAPGH